VTDSNDDNDQTDDDSKNCLRDFLAESTQGAKEAEFKKEAERKLGDLVSKVDKEEQDYRTAYEGYKEQWKELDTNICSMKSHFEDCYDYKCFIDNVICKKVVYKEWEVRRELLNEKLCGRYKDLFLANEVLLESKNQLDAWEKITAWLKARLDKNVALYEEICKLDNCEDRYFAIYILYFELCPAHDAMGQNPVIYDPFKKYCEDSCGEPPEDGDDTLCGYPWLIEPNDYNCKLAKVWEIWRDTGIAQVTAQCRVDEIEKCKKLYEEIATGDARRNTAREEFKRFDSSCCKKRSSDHDENH